MPLTRPHDAVVYPSALVSYQIRRRAAPERTAVSPPPHFFEGKRHTVQTGDRRLLNTPGGWKALSAASNTGRIENDLITQFNDNARGAGSSIRAEVLRGRVCCSRRGRRTGVSSGGRRTPGEFAESQAALGRRNLGQRNHRDRETL